MSGLNPDGLGVNRTYGNVESDSVNTGEITTGEGSEEPSTFNGPVTHNGAVTHNALVQHEYGTLLARYASLSDAPADAGLFINEAEGTFAYKETE